jgi:hypothetical protein
VDLIYLNQPELATRNGRLNDELLRDGLTLVRDPAPITLMSLFSMRDPVVGGNAPEKIALRRAIHMAFDDDEWIRVLDGGFSSVRQQFVPPGIEGYIPGYRNPNRFDPAAANALLDRFGYRRGNDRMRRNPDGSTLSVGFRWTPGRRGASAGFIKRIWIGSGSVSPSSLREAELLKRMLHCRFGMALMDFGFEVPTAPACWSFFFGKSIGGMNMSAAVPSSCVRAGAGGAGRCRTDRALSHHAIAPRCLRAGAATAVRRSPVPQASRGRRTLRHQQRLAAADDVGGRAAVRSCALTRGARARFRDRLRTKSGSRSAACPAAGGSDSIP